MQIASNIAHLVAGAGSSPTDTSSTSSTTSSNPVTSMGNEQTFLQLMVAQIQNQDPLSPTDSTQFVTQLAQFSSLEQLIGIHQSVDTLNTKLNPTGTPSTGNTNPVTGG